MGGKGSKHRARAEIQRLQEEAIRREREAAEAQLRAFEVSERRKKEEQDAQQALYIQQMKQMEEHRIRRERELEEERKRIEQEMERQRLEQERMHKEELNRQYEENRKRLNDLENSLDNLRTEERQKRDQLQLEKDTREQELNEEIKGIQELRIQSEKDHSAKLAEILERSSEIERNYLEKLQESEREAQEYAMQMLMAHNASTERYYKVLAQLVLVVQADRDCLIMEMYKGRMLEGLDGVSRKFRQLEELVIEGGSNDDNKRRIEEKSREIQLSTEEALSMCAKLISGLNNNSTIDDTIRKRAKLSLEELQQASTDLVDSVKSYRIKTITNPDSFKDLKCLRSSFGALQTSINDLPMIQAVSPAVFIVDNMQRLRVEDSEAFLALTGATDARALEGGDVGAEEQAIEQAAEQENAPIEEILAPQTTEPQTDPVTAQGIEEVSEPMVKSADEFMTVLVAPEITEQTTEDATEDVTKQLTTDISDLTIEEPTSIRNGEIQHEPVQVKKNDQRLGRLLLRKNRRVKL